MNKFLVFTYYWPPSGGPAVQRWLALSELLPEFGIEPIIITVDEQYASYTLIDESLNERISSSVEVHKTKTFEVLNFYQKSLGKGKLPTAGFANESNPSFLQKMARWVRGNFFFPDPRKGWNKFAIAKAEELIAKGDIKGVITAGPPQSTHLIGRYLKRNHKLFWLCDFHDAWTNVWYYDELMKTSMAKNIDAKMELSVLKEADRIITVGEQIMQDFALKLGSTSKVSLHSMGYDDDVFSKPIDIPENEFVITYTGTMASNYEPDVFFKAVKELLDAKPEMTLRVDLFGLIADKIKDTIAQLNLEGIVSFKGYVSHHKAVEALMSSCMLLLVNPNTVQAKMIIPGKIYEYMASRLPILNIAAKNTESASILEKCNAGKTFERNEMEAVKSFILEYYTNWELDKNSILNQDKTYIKYSRSKEAKQLASLLKTSI